MGKAGNIIAAALVALAAVFAVILFAAIFGNDTSGDIMSRIGPVVDVLFTVALVAVSIGVYFLPTIIAACRRIPNAVSVAVVNLFLGWTFIGWVVALAMAVAGND